MPEDSGGLDDPSKRLLLIVDDDPGVLDFISQTAVREGFRVERAERGDAVLRKVKTLQPDLIVLDILLPGRSGYEVLRELRAFGYGDIPVLMITAGLVDERTIELIKKEPNVSGFAQKPLAAEPLAHMIRALLTVI